jgi:hypothetical protein
MEYIKEASSPTENALITYQGKTTEAEKTLHLTFLQGLQVISPIKENKLSVIMDIIQTNLVG